MIGGVCMSVWGDVCIVLYTVTAVLSTILSSLFQHEMAGCWDGGMDALIYSMTNEIISRSLRLYCR